MSAHKRNALVNGGSVTLSMDDLALVREYLRYAVESLSDVIKLEESYAAGKRPITAALRIYRAEGLALLSRLDAK